MARKVQNRFCSIKWAAKVEKFQPREKFFFLTFPFIALATLLGGCMNQKLRQRRRGPGQKL